MKTPSILAALLICMSLGSATVSYEIRGYSTGFYDYTTSANLYGNSWGSSDSVFAPDGFSSFGEYEGYNCGNDQDFSIITDQTLTFYKMPDTPDDPYFHDWSSTYGSGSGRDTATVTTSAGMSTYGPWASGGISTNIEAKDDYVLYGLYATDYQGWSVDGVVEAYSFHPDTITVTGGATFDPETSLYPYAGISWDIS